MNPILIAVIIIGIVGLIGAILLVVASKAFAVTEDERAKNIELALPGANCGACGYSGCADYARAVVEGAPVNQCIPGGVVAARKIAIIMGVEADAATEYKAIVACQGDNVNTNKRFEYHGIESCAACNVFFNGLSSCPYGCLGFGDCAKACKFGAIEIVDGLARVNQDKCTGCGACKAACPKKIIFMYLFRDIQRPVVMCSNHEKGALTRKECSKGCIGCGKCVRNCPAGAMSVIGNVARVDFTKCTGCLECVNNCPVGCITFPNKYREKTGDGSLSS